MHTCARADGLRRRQTLVAAKQLVDSSRVHRVKLYLERRLRKKNSYYLSDSRPLAPPTPPLRYPPRSRRPRSSFCASTRYLFFFHTYYSGEKMYLRHHLAQLGDLEHARRGAPVCANEPARAELGASVEAVALHEHGHAQ